MNKKLSAMIVGLAVTAIIAACSGGSSPGATPPPPAPAAQNTMAQGAITAFGSIYVNGIEFETNSAQVEINDSAGRADELRIGQIVTVTGQRDSSVHGSASRIAYDPELRGAITAIDAPNSSFTVLGQTIATNASTVYHDVADFSGLASGLFVEVSGSRDVAGVIHASFVEVESAASAQLEIKGLISGLDAGARKFLINSQAVNYAGASITPSSFAPTNGQLVEVRGSLVGSVLNATSISREDESHGSARDEVSIEGLVQSLNSSTQFVLSGTTVQIGSSTVFRNGTAANIVVNAEVEVEGTLDANLVLQARSISFEHEANIRAEANVQAVDSTAQTVTVLGIVFHVDATTRLQDKRSDVQPFHLSNLVVGDYVELAAVVLNGQVVATRLERDDASSRIEFRAPLASANEFAHSIVLQGLTIDLASAEFRDSNEAPLTEAQFYAQAPVGTSVQARGGFDGTVLHASEAEIENHESDD